jgi:hypothetical protein
MSRINNLPNKILLSLLYDAIFSYFKHLRIMIIYKLNILHPSIHIIETENRFIGMISLEIGRVYIQ